MAKRLTDLFKVGRTIVFEDGDTVIEVWLQKLVPSETATAIERASARRSKFLTLKSPSADPDQVEYQRAELQRLCPTRDDLVNMAAGETMSQLKESVEAETAAKEEWAENDYFLGLKEAWENEVERAIQDGSEDPEHHRVYDELKRFADQVDEAYKERQEDIYLDYKSMSDAELEDKAFSAFIDNQADSVWLREYRDCQLWLGTREPQDHSKRYFTRREEINELATEVLTKLISEYVDMEVGPTEGKE